MSKRHAPVRTDRFRPCTRVLAPPRQPTARRLCAATISTPCKTCGPPRGRASPCYTGSRAPPSRPPPALRAVPRRLAGAPRRLAAARTRRRTSRRLRRPRPRRASSAHADVCAGGGGQDTDSISAPFVPRGAGRLLHRPAERAEDLRRQGQALDGRGLHDRVRRRVRGVQALRARSRRRPPVRRRERRPQQRRGQPLALHDRRRRLRDVHEARRRRRGSGARHGEAARRRRRGRDEQQQRLRVARAVPRRADVRDRGHEDDAAADGRRRTSKATGAIAKDIGAKLPGSTDMLPAAAALPAASRIPLGHRVLPEGRARRSRASARWRSGTTRTATSAGATSRSCARTPTPRRRPSARSS